MSAPRALFEINPSLDLDALAAEFAAEKRVQVRDVLTDEAARTIRDILTTATPWGLAWRGGASGPHGLNAQEVASMPPADRARISDAIRTAMHGGDYAFLFGRYPLLDAYLQRWAPGSPHDLLIEHINSEPFLNIARRITGLPSLIKADAQATLYGPNHFLAIHDDSHVGEGWQVAYVLNLGLDEWRPEWGGQLMFHDDDGEIVRSYRPRFNALNLFRVPQRHSVSYVPPFAPPGRIAITGWLRDR